MICLSITNIKELKRIQQVDFIEIRLDKMAKNYNEGLNFINQIPSNLKNKLIFTCRANNHLFSIQERLKLYQYALQKCSFLDLDIYDDKIIYEQLILNNIKLIVSYHNFIHTPSFEELKKIYQEMSKWKPHYYKIITLGKHQQDNITITKIRNLDKLISAFCMGKKYQQSRIENYLAKRFLNYISVGNHKTASGQFSLKKFFQMDFICKK